MRSNQGEERDFPPFNSIKEIEILSINWNMILTMLIPIQAAQPGHRLRWHPAGTDLHVIIFAGSICWRVQLKIKEVEAQLAYVYIAHFHCQIAKLFIGIRRRVGGILEVNHFFASSYVTGSRNYATRTKAGGTRRRWLSAEQFALESRVTGATLIR